MALRDEETRVLDQVSARLRSRFPQAASDRLSSVVRTAYHDLDGAKIRDFVEILVEREAARELAGGAV